MRLLLEHNGPLNGEFLMERDRAELERAAEGGDLTVVRFYKWEVPTLSLGFHQGEDKIDFARLREAKVPSVRRPTGGAAVLHSEEITYSVVWPEAHAQHAGNYLQELVGRAITNALNHVGVVATLDSRGEALGPLSNRTSCFSRTSRWEVAVNGKKIVGSAQRRYKDAVLQHGSILLGPDHFRIAEFMVCASDDERRELAKRLSEKATCASDELGAPVNESEFRQALESEFRELALRLDEFVAAHSSEAIR